MLSKFNNWTCKENFNIQTDMILVFEFCDGAEPAIIYPKER